MDQLRQDAQERQEQAISIAVLQTQMLSVLQGQADQKRVNEEQSKQLADILTKLSEAKGGWRILMLLGGAAAGIGSVFTWAAQHIRFN